MVAVEVCVDSLESARNALRGGASRVEVCAALSLGGLTPSVGLVRAISAHRTATLGASTGDDDFAIMAMLRPRAGDFCFNEDEWATMVADIAPLLQAGASGFVVGVLTVGGEVAVPAVRSLLATISAEAARLGVPREPLITFHRAIDMAKCHADAVRCLVAEFGGESRPRIHHILTSGGAASAPQALAALKRAVELAAGSGIEVMAGGGVTADNAANLARATGAQAVHCSARTRRTSRMEFRKDGVYMGSADRASEEFEVRVASPSIVSSVVEAVRSIGHPADADAPLP